MKIIETRAKIDTPNTHLNDRSLFCPFTDTFSEMMQPCK